MRLRSKLHTGAAPGLSLLLRPQGTRRPRLQASMATYGAALAMHPQGTNQSDTTACESNIQRDNTNTSRAAIIQCNSRPRTRSQHKQGCEEDGQELGVAAGAGGEHDGAHQHGGGRQPVEGGLEQTEVRVTGQGRLH